MTLVQVNKDTWVEDDDITAIVGNKIYLRQDKGRKFPVECFPPALYIINVVKRTQTYQSALKVYQEGAQEREEALYQERLAAVRKLLAHGDKISGQYLVNYHSIPNSEIIGFMKRAGEEDGIFLDGHVLTATPQDAPAPQDAVEKELAFAEVMSSRSNDIPAGFRWQYKADGE